MKELEAKREKGRPKTAARIPDVLKIILIPVAEPSDQFEKRAREVRDIIAQMILLERKSKKKRSK